jgi:hypothetical protein
VGVDVVTTGGRGRVLAHEILSRQLLVQMEDNRRIMIHADDVLSQIRPQKSASPAPRNDQLPPSEQLPSEQLSDEPLTIHAQDEEE